MRMHWVYYFGRVLIHILLFPVAFLRVRGHENIPGPGPYLIVGNHNHLADPPIVGTAIKYRAVFMAKAELWDNAWALIVAILLLAFEWAARRRSGYL